MAYSLMLKGQISVETTSGIQLTTTGSAQVELTGDWQNAGALTPEFGTLTLDGTGNQNVLNTSGSFYNLTVNKTGGEAILSGDINIQGGTLSILNSDLTLNGFIVTFDGTATLNETPGNTAKGTSGYLTTTRTLNGASAGDIAGFGLDISPNNDFGSTEIRRSHAAQTIYSNSAILRTYEIIPTNTGFTADVVFTYDQSELNGQTEGNLSLFRSVDGGTNWTSINGNLNTTNNTLTAQGVELSGLFTLSDAPPAATLDLAVMLQGRVTFNGVYTVDLYDETGTFLIQSYVPTANSAGSIIINGIAPDRYRLAVKNSIFLQTVASVDLMAGTNQIAAGTLRAGDSNNDNFVTITDFSILATTFNLAAGESGYDDRADFNDDNLITTTDFSLLASNFNTAGDEPLLSLLDLEERNEEPLIAEQVNVRFDAPNTPIQIGQEFQVQIIAESQAQTIDAIANYFQFDPTHLELMDIIWGEALPVQLANQVEQDGQVTLVAGALESFPSGKVGVATLIFKALEAGTTSISPDWDGKFQPEATFHGNSILGEVLAANIVIEGAPFEAQIYPVPTNGFLTLEVSNPVEGSDVNVQIINTKGQVVYQNQIIDPRTRLDLTTLSAGVYHLQVRSGDEVIKRQFVLTK